MKTVDDIFNEIYDATYTSCLIYVTCKCRNTQDIPDILQETYMSLYNILAKKGSSHIKNYEAYVISIAKSKVYKQYSLQERLRYIIPLFGKEYKRIVDKEIETQVKERAKKDRNLLYYYEKFYASKGAKGIEENQQFYINKSGNPVIVFDKYIIAPEYAGIQEFEIKK